MKYNWQDLPERKNCFTVRRAAMINLNTNKVIRVYSANTKIAVVQKCVTTTGTYYRTSEAAHHYLNYAFRAADFGLPDEKAPSAHSSKSIPSIKHSNSKSANRTHRPTKKTKNNPKVALPKDGEGGQRRGWLDRIFRRKNG